MEATVQVHIVKGRDMQPLAPRWVGEAEFRHGDMLRYDLAFADPNNPSRVVFPIFKGKYGRTPTVITNDRWHSFGLFVEPKAEEYVTNLQEWVTFRHLTAGDLALTAQNLGTYLSETKQKIAGWR